MNNAIGYCCVIIKPFPSVDPTVNRCIAAAAGCPPLAGRCRQMVFDVVIEVDGGRQNWVHNVKVTTGHVMSCHVIHSTISSTTMCNGKRQVNNTVTVTELHNMGLDQSVPALLDKDYAISQSKCRIVVVGPKSGTLPIIALHSYDVIQSNHTRVVIQSQLVSPHRDLN